MIALLLAAAVDTLVVGTLSDPVTLDPHRATDIVSAEIVSNVCEPLVRFPAARDMPAPGLATTWATADGRNWTLTLRDGVVFQDGAPLDADAVVANLDNLRRQHRFDGRAERAGRLLVTIVLDRPNASILATLSQPFLAIVSPRQLARGEGTPVCTGPFQVKSARPGEVRLQRNASYWGRPPRLETVVFRAYPDEATLARALESGEVQLTTALNHDEAGRLRSSDRVTVSTRPGLNLALLSLNTEHAPFGDPRVRQAVARAIDRAVLVHEVLGDQAVAAHNPLPPGLWGYAARTRSLLPDPRAARQLLQRAGREGGFDTTLLLADVPRPYNPHPTELAAVLREQLSAVGVRARLVTVPTWTEYLRRATAGEYDMAVLGWEADTPDPNDFLVALLGAESLGSTNRSRYHSAEMQALLERGRRSHDAGERLNVYEQAQELFQREMPWVPLYHVSRFTAQRRELKGIVSDAMGVIRLEKAWIDR